MKCNYCEKSVNETALKVNNDYYCDKECAFLEGLVCTVCCSKIDEAENLKQRTTSSDNVVYVCKSKEDCLKEPYTLQNFRKLLGNKTAETYTRIKEINQPPYNKRIVAIQQNSLFAEQYLNTLFRNENPRTRGHFVYNVDKFYISNTVVLQIQNGKFVEQFNYLEDGNLERLTKLARQYPRLPFEIMLAILDTKRNVRTAIQKHQNLNYNPKPRNGLPQIPGIPEFRNGKFRF